MRTTTPRPTTYRGVEMRSRLEADVAGWLDRHEIRWEYEPKCFGNEVGQYLPDFSVSGGWFEIRGFESFYIEVKPYEAITLGQLDQAIARMEVIWDSEPKAALSLWLWRYGDRGPALQILGSHFSHEPPPPDFPEEQRLPRLPERQWFVIPANGERQPWEEFRAGLVVR